MAQKVLIIDAGVHQGFAQGKLNHHYAQLAQETLSAMGYEVTISRVEDQYDVATEASKIVAADYIIVQTPGFWMSIPWQLKKYIDEVFCDPSIAKGDGRHRADPSAKYGTGGELKGKHYMLVSTWNAPKEAFEDPEQFFEGKGIDGLFMPLRKTFEFIGIKDQLPSFTFNDVVKNPDHEGDKARYLAHLKANF